MRSFDSTTNYQIQEFVNNPDQVYLNYYDEFGNVITEINLIKGVLSQEIFIRREDDNDDLFARSFILTA